jgi:hypothetical protein
MEFNWSIIGWIAGLVFVYLFGIWEGRGQGYKKRKKEEQEEIKSQPAPEPRTVTETVTVKVDDPGLLRLKNENGSFALDLDGARVNPVTLLPEQRKRLIEILNVMRPWLEGKPAPAPSVTPHLLRQCRPIRPACSSSRSTGLASPPARPSPAQTCGDRAGPPPCASRQHC